MKKVLNIKRIDYSNNYHSFIAGVENAIPLMIGLIPFGIAYGIVARQAGLSWAESYLMSVLVFAGAAQFAAVGMLAQSNGSNALIIIFTTLLINLRHLLMGASLAPYLQRLNFKWQALLAFGMVDESYAITISRFTRYGSDRFFQLGANSAVYFAWTTLSGAGALLGEGIEDPLKWGLDFAMPATFIALLVPQIKGKKEILVCLTSVVMSIIGIQYLPGKWYIILAAIFGAIVGGGLEECERK